MINIVLYEPEIPQNTGNIMRTCVAIGAKLHLIAPMGFKIDEKKLRRSAVDYYDKIKYFVYDNWQDFVEKNTGEMYFLTRYGQKNYADIKKTSETIYLVFGKESTGIAKEILKDNLDNCFRIPTSSDVRSLNLSNAVAIVSYEILRQVDYAGLEKFEPEIHKGKSFLTK